MVEDRDFCIQMHKSLLLELLMKVAVAPDLATPEQQGISQFAVQPDAAAHEQQQLLWNILIVMCENSSNCCREIMKMSFMDALLLYVDIDKGQAKVLLWNGCCTAWMHSGMCTVRGVCSPWTDGTLPSCPLCGSKL
jgi:hypothetical protein